MDSTRLTARRVLGIVLAIAAGLSLVLSLIGFVGVWAYRQPTIDNLSASLDLMSATLDTTSTALTVAGDTLQTINDTVGAVQTTVNAASQTLGNTAQTLDSFTQLVSSNLTPSITAAQNTIQSAQASAETIDNFLSGLANVPFIGIKYNPDVSLHESLGKVADSLAKIPDGLANLQKSLGDTGSGLSQTADETKNLALSLDKIKTNLADAVKVVQLYQAEVTQLQATVRNLRANIGTIVTVLALALSFIIVWIAVVQVQMLFKGLEMWGWRLELFAPDGSLQIGKNKP